MNLEQQADAKANFKGYSGKQLLYTKTQRSKNTTLQWSLFFSNLELVIFTKNELLYRCFSKNLRTGIEKLI